MNPPKLKLVQKSLEAEDALPLPAIPLMATVCIANPGFAERYYRKLDGATQTPHPHLIDVLHEDIVTCVLASSSSTLKSYTDTGYGQEIAAVYCYLDMLQKQGDRCLVRGTPIDEPVHARQSDKFRDHPQRLLLFDIDGFKPRTLIDKDHREDLEKAINEAIVALLPGAFHNVSCVYTLTASCNAVNNKGVLNCRVAYVTETPTRCAVLSAYPWPGLVRGHSTKGKSVDTSVFRLIQPIFTAAPIFKEHSDPYLNAHRVGGLLKDHQSVDFDFEAAVDLTVTEDHAHQIFGALKDANEEEGLSGAYNRKAEWPALLHRMGFQKTGVDAKGERWTPGTLGCGAPGVILFHNHRIYSHHNPEDCVISKLSIRRDGSRRSFSLYDLTCHYEFNGDYGAMYDSVADESFTDAIYDQEARDIRDTLESVIENASSVEANTVLTLIAAYKLNPAVVDELILKLKVKLGSTTLATLKTMYKTGVRKNRRQRGGFMLDAPEDVNALVLLNQWGSENLLVLGGNRRENSTDGPDDTFFCEDGVWNPWGLKPNVFRGLGGKGFSTANKKSITEEIRMMILREDLTNLPTQKGVLSFKNGVLELQDWLERCDLAGAWEAVDSMVLQPPNRHYYLSSADIRDYPLDWNARCPRWLAFLDEVFEPRRALGVPGAGESDDDIGAQGRDERGDCQEGYKRMLQQLMGYLLIDDYRFQKIWCLEGRPRSGKSTVIRVIRNLLGPHRCFDTDYDSLAGRFGLENAVGKKCMLFSDVHRIKDRTAQLKERLQSISGGDTVYIDRKGIPPVSAQLTTRIVIAANELPGFFEATPAFSNRLIFIPFNNSFLGREEVDLDQKLARELPGIMAWAIQGVVDLWRNGVDESQDSVDRRAVLDEVYSPLSAFVTRHFRARDDLAKGNRGVSRNALRYVYEMWIRRPGSMVESDKAVDVALDRFSQDLRTVVGTAHQSSQRMHQGVRRTLVPRLIARDSDVWGAIEDAFSQDGLVDGGLLDRFWQ